MTSYGYIIMNSVYFCMIWFHCDCIMQLKKSFHIATNVCRRKSAITFGDLPDCLLALAMVTNGSWNEARKWRDIFRHFNVWHHHKKCPSLWLNDRAPPYRYRNKHKIVWQSIPTRSTPRVHTFAAPNLRSVSSVRWFSDSHRSDTYASVH